MKSKLKYMWQVANMPLLAILFGFIVGGVFIYMSGNNPITAYVALFKGSLGSLPSFGETMYKMTPILLTGLAAAVSFRCGLFNIGGEGQYVMAAIATVAASWYWQGLPRLILIPLLLIVGFCVGGIWGGIAGFLKAKKNINEVITTIMLNWTSLYISNYFVRLTLNPATLQGVSSEAHTVLVPETSRLLRLNQIIPAFKFSSVHSGILIALLAAVVMWFIMFKTTRGYEIRSVGLNATAAEYGGISRAKNTFFAMFLSGGLAGLAGTVQILGLVFMVNQSSDLPGYGFTGLCVALVGCSHPLGCIPAALLFGVLNNGSRQMQLAGIPSEITEIISGVILVFVAGALVVRFVSDRLKKKRIEANALNSNKEVA